MENKQENKKMDYFKFLEGHIGKEVTIFTNNGKEYKGKLRAVLTSHLNIVLDTEKEHLIFRGQAIHHVAIPRGGKNEQ